MAAQYRSAGLQGYHFCRCHDTGLLEQHLRADSDVKCRLASANRTGEGELQLGEVIREGLRFGRLLQFLKLGLPGGFSVAIEAGAWESMVAIAGKLGGSHPSLMYLARPMHVALFARCCKI